MSPPDVCFCGLPMGAISWTGSVVVSEPYSHGSLVVITLSALGEEVLQ